MFRLRIALLVVFLSGAVLVGFGLFSNSVIDRVLLDRIDHEIRALGESHLSTVPPRAFWQTFDNSLKAIYGEEGAQKLIVQILGPREEILYQSKNWPREITVHSFPGFDARMSSPEPNTGAPGTKHDALAAMACEGKSAGSQGLFVNPRGETITGRCEQQEGRLVLAPENRPRSGRGGPPWSRGNLSAGNPDIKESRFATIPTRLTEWRTGIMGTNRITVLIGIDMASFYQDAGRYRRALLYTVPLALLLLAIGGWGIAERALRPVLVITRIAEGITARGLGRRIPPTQADRELTRLVEVINGMLDRLEKSFGQAIRFSADAAHQLQTPLAILQGELDDAIQHASVGSEEQRRYSALLEQVQGLKAIVQKLLLLAQADAGRLEPARERVDLSAMVAAAAEDAEAIAPGFRIEQQIERAIAIKGDRILLGQAIHNLIANAIKYNQPGGLIRVSLTTQAGHAGLEIGNTGPAIPAEERDPIFDRFYRGRHFRGQAIPGSGLGLSVAREIARAHGGDLRLDPDRELITFILTLPLETPD